MRSHYFEQVNFFLVFSCNLFKFSSVFYPFLLLFSWQFQFWYGYIWLTVVFLNNESNFAYHSKQLESRVT